MTLWKNLVVALVAAFALAACSSNDNGGSTSDETPPAATGPTQDELDAEKKARAEAEAEAKRLREEQEKAAMEDGAKAAEAVFNELSRGPANDFVTSPTQGVSSFSDDDYDSDKLKMAMLEVKDPSPTVVYDYDAMNSKRDSVGRLLRTKGYGDAATRPVTPAPGNAGYFQILQAALNNDIFKPFIASDSFKDSGQTPFVIERTGQALMIPGTFDGASGTYICTGPANTTCIAQKRQADGYTLSGGTWEFRLSSNDVNTVEPDTMYLVWGWWTETSAAGSVRFGSFVHPEGSLAPVQVPNDLGGKATYNGKALGQYALYDPLPGQVKESGKFTANAKLEATFGDTEDELSGMLSGFMTASGEKDWTVKLRKTAITAGVVNSPVSGNTQGTVWEIDDKAANAGGRWDAQFYSDVLDDAPLSTPSDVAGTFNAVYSGTGRMAGAFAAEHDTK